MEGGDLIIIKYYYYLIISELYMEFSCFLSMKEFICHFICKVLNMKGNSIFVSCMLDKSCI